MRVKEAEEATAILVPSPEEHITQACKQAEILIIAWLRRPISVTSPFTRTRRCQGSTEGTREKNIVWRTSASHHSHLSLHGLCMLTTTASITPRSIVSRPRRT